MATLNITNSFVSGTLIKSAEVNQNFQDIVNWSTQIAQDNFATFTGTVTWNVTSNVKSLSITSTSQEGAVEITHNSNVLFANKPLFKITDSVAQTNSGVSLLWLENSSASNQAPLINLKKADANPYIKLQDSSGNDRTSIYNNRILMDDTAGGKADLQPAYLKLNDATASAELRQTSLKFLNSLSDITIDSNASLGFIHNFKNTANVDIAAWQQNGSNRIRFSSDSTIVQNHANSGSGYEFIRCFDSSNSERFRVKTDGQILFGPSLSTTLNPVSSNAVEVSSGTSSYKILSYAQSGLAPAQKAIRTDHIKGVWNSTTQTWSFDSVAGLGVGQPTSQGDHLDINSTDSWRIVAIFVSLSYPGGTTTPFPQSFTFSTRSDTSWRIYINAPSNGQIMDLLILKAEP